MGATVNACKSGGESPGRLGLRVVRVTCSRYVLRPVLIVVWSLKHCHYYYVYIYTSATAVAVLALPVRFAGRTHPLRFMAVVEHV
eukprot:COSAG01_NODE_6776_length_3502_cov_32.970320_4_plen_85_part_00